jgi:hypothetical protein
MTADTDLFSRMAHSLSTGLASGVDRPTDDESLYAWVVDHLGVRLPGACQSVAGVRQW